MAYADPTYPPSHTKFSHSLLCWSRSLAHSSLQTLHRPNGKETKSYSHTELNQRTLQRQPAPQEDGTSSLHRIGPNDILSRGLRSLLTGPQRFLVGISKCAHGRREGKRRGRSWRRFWVLICCKNKKKKKKNKIGRLSW